MLAVLAALAYAAFMAIFAPWGYFLGGQFHALPYWTGEGTLHAKSGNYVLHLTISPTSNSSQLGTRRVSGTGTLCTPAGDRLAMVMIGGFGRDFTGLDSDHHQMQMHLYHRPGFFSTFTTERRPRLDFSGAWNGDTLVMNDGGTIASAFDADGTPYLGPISRQPNRGEKLPITLKQVGYALFNDECHPAR